MTSPNTTARARDDLVWYFADSDAAVGIRGIGFEGGGGAVWDDLRVQGLHLSHLTPEHRANMRRRIAVGEALSRMTAEDVHVLSVGFSPRNWPWQSDKHAANVRAAFQPDGWSHVSTVEVETTQGEGPAQRFRAVTVFGLVMIGTQLRDLYALRHAHKGGGDTPTPTATQLLRFVEREAEQASVALTKLRDAAEATLGAAVRVYEDVAATIRAERAGTKRSAFVERNRAAMSGKL